MTALCTHVYYAVETNQCLNKLYEGFEAKAIFGDSNEQLLA